MTKYWIIRAGWSATNNMKNLQGFCRKGTWQFQSHGVKLSAESAAKSKVKRMRPGDRIAIIKWRKSGLSGNITVQHLGVIEKTSARGPFSVTWAVIGLGRRYSASCPSQIIEGPLSETSRKVKKIFVL